MVRMPWALIVVLAVALVSGCSKKQAAGGGGTVDPGTLKESIEKIEALVFGPGKPGDGAELDRLAHGLAQQLILKASEGEKGRAERVAMTALMGWGSTMGGASDDGKYSAADAKQGWIRLRDDHFAQAPWFRK